MPVFDRSVDIAIVGAGPAGSSIAIALARAGRQVLLIDRKRFPRAKACGGCLSGRGVRRLEALLGREALNDPAAGMVTNSIRFTIGRYALNVRARGRSRLVCRERFDAWLVEQARAAGAALRTGATAELEHEAGAWRLLLGGERIAARWIVLATGAGCVPRGVHIAESAPAGQRMAAQAWTQPAGDGLPAPGGIEMHWLRGGYVGLATASPERCTVALAADLDDSGHGSPWERLRRANRSSPLWALLEPPSPGESSGGAAGFPWRPRRIAFGNLLLAGDAAGYEEPFTGEGIGLAMISADCLARAVASGGEVAVDYQRLMRRHHAPIMRRTRLLGSLLRSRLLLWLAHAPRFVPEPLLTRMIEHVHVEVS